MQLTKELQIYIVAQNMKQQKLSTRNVFKGHGCPHFTTFVTKQENSDGQTDRQGQI